MAHGMAESSHNEKRMRIIYLLSVVVALSFSGIVRANEVTSVTDEVTSGVDSVATVIDESEPEQGLVLDGDAAAEPWRLKDPTKLIKEIEAHFARYPEDFDLWLFLDNHDLNRFLYECAGNKKLLGEAIEFTKQWNRPFLYYYGTEKGYINKHDIFDGRPYADEDVRQIMKWK